MKKIFFKISFIILGVVFFCCLFTSCSPLYVIQSGWEQAKIILAKEPIEDVITDPQTDPVVTEKLKLVLRALEFSEKIGLQTNGSYRDFADIGSSHLLTILSVAPQTSLELYKWWFPIVGSVPYKGYFNEEDAIAAAEDFKKEGYDTWLRPSNAFSTLGWFQDPILSTMILDSDGELLITLFHELLHQNIWIKGDVAFNESLASFIGYVVAKEFVTLFEEDKKTSLRNEVDTWWANYSQLAEKFALAYEQLSTLYNSKISKEAMLNRKKQIIKQLFPKAKKEIGNAAIAANYLYLRTPKKFTELFRLCQNDLTQFMQSMNQIANSVSSDDTSAWGLLDRKLSEKKCHGSVEK